MEPTPVKEIWAGNAHYTVDPRWRGPQAIRLAGEPTTIGWALREVLVAAVLCSRATETQSGAWQLSGEEWEKALLATAIDSGIDPGSVRADASPVEGEQCPTDVRCSLHRKPDGADLYLQGEPEQVLPRCEAMLDTHGRRWTLDPADIEERVAAMRARGLAVIAFARNTLEAVRPLAVTDCTQGLILVGLVGLLVGPIALR
jgi:magnesium-transporting ATPase (P-type)